MCNFTPAFRIQSRPRRYKLLNRSNRKVVLVTGASAGLGLALAKRLINDDQVFLILTARHLSQYRFTEAEIFESPNIWLRDLDVVDKRQTNALIKEINRDLGGVDVLINNAGITVRSTVEDSSNVYRQRQLEVNYLAPFELISRVLSRMRKKRAGKIINISSVGGFMAMPTMSAYSASKFALEGATESLWYEMRPWGIDVSLVIPGFINSDGYLNTIESEACKNSISNPASAYHQHYIGMKGLISNGMGRSRGTNEKIASKIVESLKRKNLPLRIYVTFDAWLFFTFRKFCPQKVYCFVMYKLLPNIKKWGAPPHHA